MLLFIIYMIIWIFFGLAMIMTSKWREGINWCGIIFFIMTPFIPIVADFAGLV